MTSTTIDTSVPVAASGYLGDTSRHYPKPPVEAGDVAQDRSAFSYATFWLGLIFLGAVAFVLTGILARGAMYAGVDATNPVL